MCENSQMVYINPVYAWSSAPLPHDNLHWTSFSQSGMLEYKSLYYLTYKRIINWCPSLSLLYPVLTAGIFLSRKDFIVCIMFTKIALWSSYSGLE